MLDNPALDGNTFTISCVLLLIGIVFSGGAMAHIGTAGPASTVQTNQLSPAATNPQSCADDHLQVQGKTVFQYMPSDTDPLYDGQYHPYRKAALEVVETTEAGNETLRTVETDIQGRFDACISRDTEQSERDIFVRFVADNPAGTWVNESRYYNGQVVTNPSRTYTISTSKQTVTVGTVFDAVTLYNSAA